MLVPRTLQCPNCNAGLEIGSSRITIRCPYCGTQVYIPQGLNAGTLEIPAHVEEPVVPEFAVAELTFGSGGTGPGQFDDARHIALDAGGRVYVGEYSSGRIQVFDPDGVYITGWTLDNKTPLRALAIGRGGVLYAVHGGQIYCHHPASGQLTGQLTYVDGWGFIDVVAVDGGLVAAWYKNRDDIVCFDGRGTANLAISGAISRQTGKPELNIRVAAGPSGHIYALGSFHEVVFKFAPTGEYVGRFGSGGAQPGQFQAPLDIVTDRRGHVYVSDIKGVQVFDQDGGYIAAIRTGGPAYGLFTSDGGDLWVAAGDRVIRYGLPE